jgi:hypothetical protein
MDNNHGVDLRSGHGDDIQTRRDFLQVNLGHLLILIAMLGSAIWWFVTYDRSILETRLAVTGLVEAKRSMEARIDSIDQQGTHYSQRNLDKELDVLKSTTDRINKVEQITYEAQQRLDKMTWQVNGISEWVEEQKKRDKNPQRP